MDFHRFSRLKTAARLLSLLLFAAQLPAVSQAEPSLTEQIEALDQRFHQLSANVYQRLCKQRQTATGKAASMAQLAARVEGLDQAGKPIGAICLLRNNLDVIDSNIDDPAVFRLLSVLLAHNELKTAESILYLLKEDGDRGLISNANYLFARHYLAHKEWQKTLDYLDGISADLPTEQAEHAHFIQGLALQGLKKHRKAVKAYQAIPQSSPYYPAATLNTAVAYIRQGWWTDAHIMIDKVINGEEIRKSEEFVNRLYLVLGYSLLREGFFRESREAFRNVSLDSRYTNRALLGIALTATNQEDFVGALNAINILKGKDSQDLTVDESYLLLPYIYEKLMQYLTASASYTEAMNYYRKRIAAIEASMNSDIQLNALANFSHNHSNLRIADTVIDFNRYYPESFMRNYLELDNFRKYINRHQLGNSRITREIQALHRDYARLLTKMVHNLLQQRIKYLNSYMNQARYGLARLYDINKAKVKN